MKYFDLTNVDDTEEEKDMKKISKKALIIGGSILAGVAAVGTTVGILLKSKHDDEMIDGEYSENFDSEDVNDEVNVES